MDLRDQFDQRRCYAEDAVLGALLIAPKEASELFETVKPSDFGRHTEREVFRILRAMAETNPNPDPMQVYHCMQADGLTNDDYGTAWLASLAHRANLSQALSHYGYELRRLGQLERIQSIGEAATDPDADPAQLFESTLLASKEMQFTSTVGPTDYTIVHSDHPRLNPVIVDGLLRRGETCNIIAAPKVGKSFLGVSLAWSVATGRPWLSFPVTQGKVLIIDNELHKPTLANRIDSTAWEMKISHTERAGKIDVISLRGQLCDINELQRSLMTIEPGGYSLVILDALYRTLPAKSSENDNAAMMAVYNRLDYYAAELNAAFAVVHHSSKGNQGEKDQTDVGAGAGAITRAADTHLTIRHHATEGLAVLEAVTRSFKSPEPLSIKFEYPLWHAVTAKPELKRKGKGDKSDEDKKDIQELVNCLPKDGSPIQQKNLFEDAAVGTFQKSKRLADKMVKQGLAERKNKGGKRKNGTVLYRLPQVDSEADSSSDSEVSH